MDNRSSIIAPILLKEPTTPLPNYLSDEEKKVFVQRAGGAPEEGDIQRGINIDRGVLDSLPFGPVPTHEILTLSFQKTTVTTNTTRMLTTTTGIPVAGLHAPASVLQSLIRLKISDDPSATRDEVALFASRQSQNSTSSLARRSGMYVTSIGGANVFNLAETNQLVRLIQQSQSRKSAGIYNGMLRSINAMPSRHAKKDKLGMTLCGTEMAVIVRMQKLSTLALEILLQEVAALSPPLV